MSISISGTGSALPNKIITNHDLTAFLDTSDEWIRTRTGIGQRHILENETITDIAVEAAREALSNANTHPDEIDYILCATLGGDYVTPSLACMVQERLQIPCPALDVNGACSGFLYALDVAAGFFARKRAKKILLIAAEGLSRIADWTDRSTCVLFGDGAGAVVLEDNDNLLYLHVTSTGNAPPLYMHFQSGNYPGKKAEKPDHFLRMDGSTVFKFAVTSIAKEVKRALKTAGISPDQIDHVLLHQANMRIIDSAKKKLGIAEEKYLANIEDVGNMSAASIPVLLDKYNKKEHFSRGDILLLAGFGAGLTTGTAIIKW